MIYLGNSKLGSLYLGSTKISEAYLGSTKIYSAAPVQYPYLTFEFSVANFEPNNLPGVWTQLSSSPNVWRCDIKYWRDSPGQPQAGIGLPFVFGASEFGSAGKLIPTYLGGGTCKIIDSGNFDAQLNGAYCESLDRTFNGCTGLTEIAPIQCTRVTNLSGTFYGCTNVEDGALDQYNWFNTYALNVSNHSGTFTDCGSNTQTGAAELAQIPVGWGGTMVPASTLMTSSVTTALGNKSTWLITGNAPDWTSIVGLYLFTEASVSTYAGVSMNRSRITKKNSLATGTGNALYFYPAFAQYTGSSSSNRVITWVATTDTPNGSLTASQGNTDMAGTLDYSTYGPITREYGSYINGMDVYFLFLVTNVPIANWAGLTDAYGVLWNGNFKTDGGFRYFY